MRRLAAVLVLVLAGCTSTPSQLPTSSPTPTPTPTIDSTVASATIERWIDGDTVQTSAGRIRLIGVDTPERGTCGADTALAVAYALAPASARVRLVNPESVDDSDRYDRLLRYVEGTPDAATVNGETISIPDVGLAQIAMGAKARYDGLDGYDTHPRQADYHATDAANLDHCVP